MTQHKIARESWCNAIAAWTQVTHCPLHTYGVESEQCGLVSDEILCASDIRVNVRLLADTRKRQALLLLDHNFNKNADDNSSARRARRSGELGCVWRFTDVDRACGTPAHAHHRWDV